MLAGIRKRLARKHFEAKDCCGDDDDKDDLHSFAPPANYIKISQGKIQLVQSRSLENESPSTQQQQQQLEATARQKDKEVLERRVHELEGALLRLQEKVNNNQCGSPTFEKELREQLENMNRVMKSKERKQLQTCRDHKALQTRFARQEALLHAMQQENKALILRVRQYEHCLDDVMRKVVDAIVAEDNLREEVAMLKSRVRDLEAQNAALSASPAKGRDEGYCTMSSGQPQPSNGHLEGLPEEPEQWLLPAEPCSTEMEDWSMSQEELAVITLDEERDRHTQQQQQNTEHDWIWNSNDFLNSTLVETDSDSIAQLLQQKIVYSEDEEVACTEFTNDFYKLVNIRPSSQRSLYSYLEGETDDEDDDEDAEDEEDDDDDDDDLSISASRVRLRARHSNERLQRPSPTPSEAGRAQVTSCSSSESDELSRCTTHQELHELNDSAELTLCSKPLELPDVLQDDAAPLQVPEAESDMELEIELVNEHGSFSETHCIEQMIKTEMRRPPPPPLFRSKSTLDEDEPSCILRNNQRREIESSVVRSGSVNCAISAMSPGGVRDSKGKLQQERLLQRPMNSWRKSNGWKRVTSTVQLPNALGSPKKELRSEFVKIANATQKVHPATRIPTPQFQANSTAKQMQQPQQHQLQPRKSKIPPPVPVRRSYAS